MAKAQGQIPHDLWDQLPGEPDKWYGRFQIYLDLGVTRTLTAAARCGSAPKPGQSGLTGRWSYYFNRYHWRERARAWDMRQRELLALSERNTRVALRIRRIERMEDYLDEVCEVLDSAHMGDVDEKQARAWLPQMRVFLRDLLVAERQEFEHPDYERDDPLAGLQITADDLRAAQRVFESQRGETPAAPSVPAATRSAAGWTATISSEETACPAACLGRFAPGRTLLVCNGLAAGSAPGPELDLPTLRAVRAATGLDYMRVLNTTSRKFAGALRRERGLGRPIELLHLAVPVSPAGVRFADGVFGSEWLLHYLQGMRILLFASCTFHPACDSLGSWLGESLGDCLGRAPYVVAIGDEIMPADAALLARHFWHNIGLAQDPAEALATALQRCPSTVAAHVHCSR
ncbi:MAG: hypothetical protein U0X20_25885 [Caldilineaceae bacterium]